VGRIALFGLLVAATACGDGSGSAADAAAGDAYQPDAPGNVCRFDCPVCPAEPLTGDCLLQCYSHQCWYWNEREAEWDLSIVDCNSCISPDAGVDAAPDTADAAVADAS